MVGIALIPNESGTAYDLDVRSGHLKLAEVTHQNQAMLLAAHPGEYKENPLLGVGLSDILQDHDLRGWRSRIIQTLEADGQRVRKVELTNAGLTIEAEYR